MTILPRPGLQLGEPGQVEDTRGSKPAEIDVDQDVGTAGQRERLRMRRFQGKGFVECSGQENFHSELRP